MIKFRHLFVTVASFTACVAGYAQQDVTATYLQNPSFESGLDGWANEGMQTQTNSYFSIKDGRTYCESWVNRGQQLGNRAVSQTIANLPMGRYELSAATLHIQQASANSTDNAGDPQTGACIFAGASSTPINSLTERKVQFVSLGSEVTIGMRAVDATGNWVCVDNFRLVYLGDATTADIAQALLDRVAEIEAGTMDLRMQNVERQAMTQKISQARQLAANAAGTSVEAYLASVKDMLAQLDAAEADCLASAALYDKLDNRIEHATKALDWLKEDPNKVATLQTAINVANAKAQNFDLTDTQLTEAEAELLAAIRSVDKEIYTAQWMLGDVTNPDNEWYIGRTVESRDWVLFWQKGYGDKVPVNARCGNFTVNAYETLDHAQTAFTFYADSLHFIDRNNSKTQQYKMIIRLRYEPTEWEATGSGIDDKIGLLTLTPWAQTSRNWQTVYHEVGHCFQYQTHCDNGDMNGWMYEVGRNGCAFWEQCAQWQAYKIMPFDQFTNEWYNDYLKNTYKHILHESPRYNNYFVQDYWTMLHGWDFIGRLWNESVKPEDAVQAYQRITDITNDEFNDEMWDCAARFATWDIPHLEPYHKNAWTRRQQPTLTLDDEGYWVIDPENALENTGHNIIQLNAPTDATTVSVEFQGLAGDERYRQYYWTKAGWRYGFVAYLADGSRVYGSPGRAANKSGNKEVVTFECPANCKRLWLVVSGAATEYRVHGWDDNDKNDEQYGYRVRFDNTNLIGNANTNFSGVEDVTIAPAAPQGIYTLSGIQLPADTNPSTLPSGFYIVNGKKLLIP